MSDRFVILCVYVKETGSDIKGKIAKKTAELGKGR